MKSYSIKPVFIWLMSLWTISLSAQDIEIKDKSIISRIEGGIRSGYVFNSNSVLLDRMVPDATESHSSTSWHLRYSFSLPNTGRTSSVYQGVGLSLTTFGQHSTVGRPVGLYVFQGAPIAIISPGRLSLDYEWNFGVTTGWKATSSGDDIRSNLVVGSSTNAYINLGLMVRYGLSSSLQMTGGIDLSHYSNGNTSWPNPGVNTIGGRIGIVYIPGGAKFNPRSPFTADDDYNRGISYDIMAFGAWRKAYFPADDGAFSEEGEKSLLPGHFGVAGINFAPMWDIHPTFRAGVSADLQWSENTGLTRYHIPDTYGEDAKFTRPPFMRQVSLGLSARAELVMPIFSINAGIGYGLAGPGETRKLYQVLNLKSYLYGPVYLNIGYRLVEFHSPANLMLGVGVTLGR